MLAMTLNVTGLMSRKLTARLMRQAPRPLPSGTSSEAKVAPKFKRNKITAAQQEQLVAAFNEKMDKIGK